MIGCKKTKLKTSGLKKSWVKLMLLGQKWLFGQKYFAKFEMTFLPQMAS